VAKSDPAQQSMPPSHYHLVVPSKGNLVCETGYEGPGTAFCASLPLPDSLPVKSHSDGELDKAKFIIKTRSPRSRDLPDSSLQALLHRVSVAFGKGDVVRRELHFELHKVYGLLGVRLVGKRVQSHREAWPDDARH
jgi:hypothetical protein